MELMEMLGGLVAIVVVVLGGLAGLRATRPRRSKEQAKVATRASESQHKASMEAEKEVVDEAKTVHRQRMEELAGVASVEDSDQQSKDLAELGNRRRT